MINWRNIRDEFESSSCTMKSLAEKHKISPSTLRSRKNRENWQRKATRNVATPNDVVATNRRGGQKNNRNAKGNSGGAPPKRNQNAKTHGLFSKHLPNRTRELMDQLADSEPADIIWNNIMIQYSAIINAQKIMFVASKSELTKDTKKWSSGEGGRSEEYELQYAWEKQANFLNAQSRAMSTLSSLIKQFVAIADEADERAKKLQLMQSQINLLEAKSGEVDGEIEDDGFLAALESEGETLWPVE